jgi:ubiquitin carboxyl-terminal hydrolase 7
VPQTNDRLAYPPEIDLSEFLNGEVDREPLSYTLHHVIVHAGDLTGGHYYSFAKPNPHKPWLKFDEDRITPALESEVFGDNFGGSNKPRPAAAYTLVYIRTSMMPELLAPVTELDIPPALSMSTLFVLETD